jgi:hypothetical protein
MAVAAFPPVAAAFRDNLADWVPVYLAGGIGGLVMELLASRWQLEMPSITVARRGRDRESETHDEAEFGSPRGVRVDIGVFGRFFTGGLAAVVFIVLAAVVVADESITTLQGQAGTATQIAWAIALGASSTAIWRAIRRIVEARVSSVRREYAEQLSSTKKELEQHKKIKKEALEQLRHAQTRDADRRRAARGRNAVRRASLDDGSGGHVVVPRGAIAQRLHEAFLREPTSADEATRLVTQSLEDMTRTVNVPDLEDDAESDEESSAIDQAIGALMALNG